MGGGQSSPAPAPPPQAPAQASTQPTNTAPAQFAKSAPPNLSLQIGPGKSTNCLTCAITIDPTLSSATVVLSRDILGKIQQPALPYPPSNLPKVDPSSGTDANGNGKNGCGRTGGKGYGPPGNVCCNNGCWYIVPHPNRRDDGLVESDTGPITKFSWADGTLLSDHRAHAVRGNNTNEDWTSEYLNQLAEEIQHKKDWDAKNAARLQVRIWNPSDDPKDPARSIAINNREFGALTKLFVKPTIPFPVSFSLAGPRVQKSEPPPPPPTENERQNAGMDPAEREKEARQNPLRMPGSH